MEKLERIIRKIEEGKTITEVAKEEKINRYSISLTKQCMEKYKREIEELTELIDKEKIKYEERLKELEQEKKRNLILGIIIGILGSLLTSFLIHLLYG